MMTSRTLSPLLDTLIAVYETQQFTAAAGELGVSQSSVSNRIAHLEAMVGTALFTRRAKSDVVATNAGTRLYESAIEIMRIWTRATYDLIDAAQHREAFTLLLSHTAASTLLPLALSVLSNEPDDVDFSARTVNSDETVAEILLKHAQMGIVEKPVSVDSVRLVPLSEDRLVLAGKCSGTPGRPNRDGAAHDLWMIREAGSGVRYYTDLFFRTTSTAPRRMIELASNEEIVSALRAGIGCSIISQACVPEGVPTQELGSAFVRHFYAVLPKSGLTPGQHVLAERIIDAIVRFPASRPQSDAMPTPSPGDGR